MKLQQINNLFINTSLKKQPPKKAKDLGKNDFLRLLVTQLSHQDPLEPMDDREFIVQLAQFTALEQSIQMNKSLLELRKISMLSQLQKLLGKTVKVFDKETGKFVTGKITETYIEDSTPYIKVNGKKYSTEDIRAFIHEDIRTDKKINNPDNKQNLKRGEEK